MATTDGSFQPDRFLLATNIFPTPSESQMIRTRLEERRHNRHRLDTHIESLEIQLQEARVERGIADKSCELLGALLAPVRKIPSEILGEVFVHCVQPDANSFDLSESAPLIISRVCRTWRTVASDTPRLWKTLTTGTFDTLHEPMPLPNPRAIEMWLRNSKACGLSITFQPGPSDPRWKGRRGFSPADPSRVCEILQLFRKHLHRICVLRVSMEISLASWLNPHDTPTVYPRLTSASISLWERGRAGEEPHMLRMDAPVLTTLEAMSLTFSPGIRVPFLRTLTVHAPPATVFSFLSLCPLLEAITWWPDRIDSPTDPLPPITVPLISLKILNMFEFEAPTLLSVLAVLTGALHALEELAIYGACLYDDGMSFSFGLSLSRLSKLKHLSIDTGYIDQGFFRAMASNTSHSLTPCPYLSKLKFIDVDFPADDLIQFIRNRAQPLDALPGRHDERHLESVRLDHLAQLHPCLLNSISELRETYNIDLETHAYGEPT